MGRISRLRTITKSRIEAFLASLEKPEIILPELMREMEEKVKETARAEAKALSAVKGDRRRLDTGSGKVIRFKEGAVLAVKANEIDTARQAIAAQIQAEKEVEKCRNDLAISESAYNSASQVRRQLRQNLKELKLKKNDIIKRSRQIRRELSLNEKLDSFSSGAGKNILDVVARMESKVDEAEAEIEVRDEITRTLGISFRYERVKVLESDAEVDRRLNAIKGKIHTRKD
ncbi:MAG: PspA/IM30 family protein [Planctomycetes bacterium]|nr:PspA/IM30 family protein [Planctomycetota bacterium]